MSQVAFIEKARTEKMYFVAFDGAHQTATVLGKKYSHKGRETYTVTLDGATRSIRCTCMSFKFKASREGTSCKHICFVLLKVVKLASASRFFAASPQKLSAREARTVVDALQAAVGSRPSGFNCGRTDLNFLEDKCPICYDVLGDRARCAFCPDCKNAVHAECIVIWLEVQRKCVYCRSATWDDFTR